MGGATIESVMVWLEILVQRWRETHDEADARAILAEGQLADHPKDLTPLRQQMNQLADPGRMTPYGPFPPTRPPQQEVQYSHPSQIQGSLRCSLL